MPEPPGPNDHVEQHPPRRRAVLPGPKALGSQLKKGMPTLLVLATLATGEQYGYGLLRNTWVQTRGLFTLREGPLYGLLARLERRRLVKSRLETVGGRPRRYYVLTARGRQELAAGRTHWRQLRRSMDQLLN